MKIALICPSNNLYMPYVDSYKKELKNSNANVIYITWDRFGIENKSEYVYRDRKKGHQRNIYDYFKFYIFVLKIIKRNKIDKIIVFGLQMAFFLKGFLIRRYRGKYIIDIRDYNKILHVFDPSYVIYHSAFTTISSPAYKEWLPESNNYVLNHNIAIENLENEIQPSRYFDENNITISYIGSLTNFAENKDLIDSLKNNHRFTLVFHGQGNINTLLTDYVNENRIDNVSIFGRYSRDQEMFLYNQADFINMVLYNKYINDKTCLANRIYRSALSGRPIISLKGIYLSEIVEKYELGIVLQTFEGIENIISEYIVKFDKEKYDNNRIHFLENVIKDNSIFKERLIAFYSKQ